MNVYYGNDCQPTERDTTLTIGRTDLIFRVVPVASPGRPVDDSTRAFGVNP